MPALRRGKGFNSSSSSADCLPFFLSLLSLVLRRLEANITFHQAGITSDDDPTIPVSFNALEAERYLRDEFPSQIAAIDKKLFLFKCQMQDVQMKCDNMRSENGKTQEQIREVEENIEWIMGELKRRGQLAAEEEAAAAAGAGASDDDEEHEEDLDLESRMATVPAAQIMDDEDDDAAVGSDSGHGHGDASEEEEAEEREGKCAGAPLLQPPAEPSAARQSVVVLQAPVDVDAAPIVMESAGPVV